MSVQISEQELHALQALSYNLRRMDVSHEQRAALKAVCDRALSDDGPQPADLPKVWEALSIGWAAGNPDYESNSYEQYKRGARDAIAGCIKDLTLALARAEIAQKIAKASRGVVSYVDHKTGQLTLLRAEDASHFVAGNRLYTAEDLGE